jgi:hypothetical protein
MVLIYTDESIGAGEINGQNWWQVLLRPGVRAGRSEPTLDPNGYRTLMAFQLAESFYRQPGLARRLEHALGPRYIRPKEADLTALVQAGELDYSWSYLSIARTAGLRHVDLPKEIDLSDPDLAEWYGQARVRLPGASRAGSDSGGAHPVWALHPSARPPPTNRPRVRSFYLLSGRQRHTGKERVPGSREPLTRRAGPAAPGPVLIIFTNPRFSVQ